LKPPQDHSSRGPRGVCCDLAAFALVRLPFDRIVDIRRNPESILGFDVPTSACKHLDAQTIAGLAAVCGAMRESGMDLADFRDWGVLAAPQFLGQPLIVSALLRYRAEGAWGVSPHVIPHHSLHAVAGTVSQVLKIHGPNLGIGGGQGGTGEALLAAAAWIGRRRVPGAWVVLTTLDPMTRLGEEGEPAPGTDSVGLAVALMPTRSESGIRVHVVPDGCQTGQPLDLLRLYAALEHSRSSRGSGTLAITTAVPRVEIEWSRPSRPAISSAPVVCAANIQSIATARMSSGAEAER
jgi:hypothetical protein